MLVLTSPVTGGAQTGFTTPTYTHALDISPAVNARQVYVTAVGGAGNTPLLHSASSPFFTSVWRPKVFAQLGKPHPVTGLLTSVPMNTYKVTTGKGVTPLAGQPSKTATMSTLMNVPAGSDIADPVNLRAMISMHIGCLNQLSAELGNSAVSGAI